MRIDIPAQVERIIGQLEACGHRAYAVGGCVRDSVMGRTPADWDIATSALPQQVMACFAEERVVETGLQHGTVTVVLEHTPYEVTTFRIDGVYSDNRRPDSVTFTADIREDLARRDFTVNAMAYHPLEGLVDPFDGRRDIERRRITCVGDPQKRFGEDALRILRAVRFAAQLDFAVAEATAAAMAAARARLDHIAAERVRVELDKALPGPGARRAFTDHRPVVLQVLPELGPAVGFDLRSSYHQWDLWGHSLRAVEKAPPDAALRLALLLHDCGKPECAPSGDDIDPFPGHAARGAAVTRGVLARLKYDNATRHTVERLVADHATPLEPTTTAVKQWLRRLGEQGLRRLLALKRANAEAHAPWCIPAWLEILGRVEQALDKVLAEGQCYRMQDMAVGGDDLLAMGLPKGPKIGALLAALLDGVIDGRLHNDRDTLLREAWELYARGANNIVTELEN